MRRFALVVAAFAFASGPAFPEDLIGADTTAPPAPSEDNTPAVLSGTLQKIRDSGVVAIGYR